MGNILESSFFCVHVQPYEGRVLLHFGLCSFGLLALHRCSFFLGCTVSVNLYCFCNTTAYKLNPRMELFGLLYGMLLLTIDAIRLGSSSSLLMLVDGCD